MQRRRHRRSSEVRALALGRRKTEDKGVRTGSDLISDSLVAKAEAPAKELRHRFKSYSLILRSSVERSICKIAAAWLLFQSVWLSVARMCCFSISSRETGWYSGAP